MKKLSTVTGIVLAGGQSRRMGGGDKSLADLAGRPMLQHVIERLRPQLVRLAISANGDPARLAQFGLPVIEDTIAGYAGPLAGILAGMRWSIAHAPDAAFLVTAPCDTPLLPTDLVARLLAPGTDGRAIVLAASGSRTHQTIGLWPVALADDMERSLIAGTRMVRAWIERHSSATVSFEAATADGTPFDPFFNVNCPEDLEAVRPMLEQLGTGRERTP